MMKIMLLVVLVYALLGFAMPNAKFAGITIIENMNAQALPLAKDINPKKLSFERVQSPFVNDVFDSGNNRTINILYGEQILYGNLPSCWNQVLCSKGIMGLLDVAFSRRSFITARCVSEVDFRDCVNGWGLAKVFKPTLNYEVIFAQPVGSTNTRNVGASLGLSNSSGFSKGQRYEKNTRSSDKRQYNIGPQHAFSIIGHLPLGVQVLLGLSMFIYGAFMCGKTFLDLDGAQKSDTILLVLPLSFICGVMGLAVFIGAMVAI